MKVKGIIISFLVAAPLILVLKKIQVEDYYIGAITGVVTTLILSHYYDLSEKNK